MKKRKYKKRKKNPHIDNTFIIDLATAIIEGSPGALSAALNYYKIGEKCDDCNELFWICACEGSREKQGFPCEECGHRYCLCDLNIFDKKGNINEEKIRKEAWEIANKTLNKSQLFVLDEEISRLYDNQQSLFLKKLLNL